MLAGLSGMATTTRNHAWYSLVGTSLELAQNPVQLGESSFKLDLGSIFTEAIHS
jgi:hypothetical protein